MAKTRKRQQRTQNNENEEGNDIPIDARKPWLCKRQSCGERFKHKTELYRHKKFCSFLSPRKPKDFYIKVGSRFQCKKCDKMFDEQSNASRHSKSCVNKELIHQCEFCDKTFKFKSHLKRHMKVHKDDIATPSFVDPSFDNEPSPSLDVSSSTTTHVSPPTDISLDDVASSSQENIETSPFDFQITAASSSQQIVDATSHSFQVADKAEFQQPPDLELSSILESDDDTITDILSSTVIESQSQPPTICDNTVLLSDVCAYLKKLHKSDSTKFKSMVIDIFGTEKLAQYQFQYFLASKLDINYSNFKRSMKLWLKSGMVETRGRPKLTLEQRQEICDMWLENSQPSTDNRNNRCLVKISADEFNDKFSDIEYKSIELQHWANKRGRKNVAANRMIATTTVRGIMKKLAAKGLTVSLGSVINNKPFFITYATEMELSLCLCKLCINMTFLFEPLMARAKKDGDDTYLSISSFYMETSPCPKSVTGYYNWKCVNRKCKECHKCLPATLKCMDSNDLVSVDQFETVQREYPKLNKKTQKIEMKKTKLTDRVSKKMTYMDLYKKILSLRKTYMIHKFYVYNDKYQWPKILATVPEYGEITHSDYSENMSQLHKREAQSCHFNKKPYSLHCTVEHIDSAKYPDLKSPYRYLYHLSDCMKHNYAYTSIVVNHCVDLNPLPTIIRRKSDNCGVQYKCAAVFGEYQKLAKRTERNVLIYYGPSGHGKGLVDAMSAFGVKGPLLHKVLTEDFSYNSATDICEALREDFKGDNQKLYFVVSEEEVLAMDNSRVKRKIPGVVKYSYHMICFFPSGKILAKVNMCSCSDCLLGKFDKCKDEKGVIVSQAVDDDDDYETDSDIEYEDDEHVEDGSDELELYEMRREAVLQITQPGDVVALFVPRKTVLQSFYLCRVLSIETASAKDMKTLFKKHPFIEEGSTYLKCEYFEKKPGSELSRNGTVVYKPRAKLEYALPTHVLFPQVNHTCIGKNIILTIQEYQWICDSIPHIDDVD